MAESGTDEYQDLDPYQAEAASRPLVGQETTPEATECRSSRGRCRPPSCGGRTAVGAHESCGRTSAVSVH